MENNVMTIKDVRCYIDEKGTAWLNAADVARGWGFTEVKGNTVYIMWRRLNGYLREFGFHTCVENSTAGGAGSMNITVHSPSTTKSKMLRKHKKGGCYLHLYRPIRAKKAPPGI